ncbi:MAG: flagellin [Angelakisella sp.]
MIIQHNIMALNAHRQLGGNNSLVQKNLEKLSSGFRINRAGDDAAGLAISEKMRAQITGLDRAKMNAQDGISLVQTAEGALTETHSMLNRLVELATQSANGTIQTDDRGKVQDEVNALTAEITRVAQSTKFNGIELLNGNLGGVANTNGASATTSFAAGAFTFSGGKLAGLGASATLTATTNATQAGTTLALTTFDGANTASNIGGVTFVVDSTSGSAAAGGSITYRAVVDKKVAEAATAEAFEGVTVTVKHGILVDKETSVATVAAGATGGGLTMQVGDTAEAFNKVNVTVANMTSAGLGIDTLNLRLQDNSASSIDTIKTAIETVSANRSKLGSLQNRLEHTINNLSVTSENMTAAESRIRDVDMAKEMMQFTKNNVLSQAAQAMLAQANQQPQQVLQLLR